LKPVVATALVPLTRATCKRFSVAALPRLRRLVTLPVASAAFARRVTLASAPREVALVGCDAQIIGLSGRCCIKKTTTQGSVSFFKKVVA
jgi:hypothetical protein